MSIVQQNAICPAILVGLNELITKNDSSVLVTPVGCVQALFDPENRQPNTVVQNVDAGSGHPKTVRVKHKQRSTKAETRTTKTCTDGDEKPYFEETFTPAQYREHSITVTEAKIRTLCDNASKLVKIQGGKFGDNQANAYSLALMAEVVSEIVMDFDGIRQAINDDILTSYVLNTGKYTDLTTSKSFNVYRSIDAAAGSLGSPVLDGYNRFKREMRRSTLNGNPIAFGEGLMELAVSSLNYGCCNNGGTDFGKMNGNPGFKWYTDYSAGTKLGNDDAFGVFMPGTVQFASFNDYVGSFASKLGIVERGTIPDPVIPGLVYDMRIIPNACSGSTVVESYTVIIGLHFDLWAAPLTQFKSGDRLAGQNGVYKAIATGI